jgi:Domain of unknown function (DUF4124)
MRDLRNAPSTRIRGWVALLAVAGCTNVSCALAQGSTIYKCTDAEGRTAFSDKPCGTLPSGAAGSASDGVKQETLRQPKSYGGNVSADSISAMCARSEDSKATAEMIQSLPQPQRDAVTSVLRGLVASAGVSRDAAQQARLKFVTLRLDESRTAIICVPQRRAQQPGAAGPTTTYTAFKVEPNGRTETLQPSQPPLVSNDANEATTMAARCSSLVTSCVRSTGRRSLDAIDECFAKAPVCPTGRLDPTATCCPQACTDAYRRERARGTDAETATIKVIFGDDAGSASCVPGMPKRG